MARLLNSLIGHNAQIQHLLEAISVGRLPSTILFSGPSGIGKKTLALSLAQVLLCENKSAACGECGPCLRVEKNQSEGVLLIKPEKNQIKIDQAHSILDFLSLRSLSKARVVIIDQAESLNPQAANALLKALEEPPPHVHFFLIALSPQHVLPTIKSRSMSVSFAPLSLQEMKKRSQAPEWALRASHGSFERLNVLQDKEEIESREQAIEFLKEWLENPKAYLNSNWKDRVRERTSALGLAHHLVLFFRDALFYKVGEIENLLNMDHKELVRKMSLLSAEDLSLASEKVIQIENSLLAHRDSLLTFEEFWLTTEFSQDRAIGGQVR